MMDESLDAMVARLKSWEGRREHAVDQITPRLTRAMAATLDWTDPAPEEGAPLPPGWHWMLFEPAAPAPARALGPDGHPARGGFLPPVPLRRRMWAGGRLSFRAPLPVGATVARRQEVTQITAKQGRTGPLVFVTVRKEICVQGVAAPALIEEHDLVYRDPPPIDEAAPAAPAPLPPTSSPQRPTARWRHELSANSTLLFRYSALTFNGHRIHYDHQYATREEGHAGLVVHGPLLATLLLALAQEALGRPPAQFEFRALSTVYVDRPFILHADPSPDGLALWVTDDGGRTAMQATARRHFSTA